MSKKCLRCEYVRRPTDTEPESKCPSCGSIYAMFEAHVKGLPPDTVRSSSIDRSANRDKNSALSNGTGSKRCVKCQYIRQATDTAPDNECPKCGVIYAKAEAWLATQNELEATVAARQTPKAMPNRKAEAIDDSALEELPITDFSRKTGIAGALILIAGVFTPVLSLPIVGSVNYFRNGQGDGVVVIGIAVLVLFFLLTGRGGKLLWTAIASLAVILFTVGRLLWKLNDLKESMESDLKGNPFRGIADMAVSAIQIEWGWIVLILGSALLFVSAIAHKKRIYSFDGFIGLFQSGEKQAFDDNFAPIQSSKEISNRSSKVSATEQLAKLAELLESGNINKSEYEQLKSNVIKTLNH